MLSHRQLFVATLHHSDSEKVNLMSLRVQMRNIRIGFTRKDSTYKNGK